jgi:NAD(P)-dependent dehydrogenase (short-subunit alcohol dehydrogenase family)
VQGAGGEDAGAVRQDRHPVNNAALYAPLAPVKVTDIDIDLWDKVMAVNVRGVF